MIRHQYNIPDNWIHEKGIISEKLIGFIQDLVDKEDPDPNLILNALLDCLEIFISLYFDDPVKVGEECYFVLHNGLLERIKKEKEKNED